jgi:hypothetical protein
LGFSTKHDKSIFIYITDIEESAGLDLWLGDSRVETMRIYLHSHVCNLPRLLIGALLSDFKGSIYSALQPL